jgi:GT2 family glycosyltransferase
MFCAAMRRDVWERLVSLDEQFGIGLFEDDDHAMRARQAGYRVVCAEDTFCAPFRAGVDRQTGSNAVHGTLFHRNRRRWEEKWGTRW